MGYEEDAERKAAPIIEEMRRQREEIVASFPKEEIFTIRIPVVLSRMTDAEKLEAFSQLERAFLTAQTLSRFAAYQMDSLIALRGDPPRRLTLSEPDLRKRV